MKFFFALLGVALAVQSSWPQDRLLNWKTQTEYRFKYEASLASGVAIPNSLSAITRHRSDVTLQVLDDKIALFQLKNVQFANDNAELPETSQFVPMERITPQELTEEHQKHIEMPVRFRFEQGVVSELQFHPDDSVWSKNVKRSIISMLQLNWEQISSDRLDRDEREFSNGNKFDLFMEKNVEGNCEVAYNLVSEKKERTTVIKSINFDNCEERLELTYNYRFTAECPECDYKKIAPQTVYKFEIEKDQLKEIELNSVYSVALKDQTLIRTKVQARLTLEKTASIDREIHTSKGPKESIVYNKEFDYAVEEYLKKGDEAKFNPMEAIPKKFEIIEEIVDKLAHQKDESSIESADYFMRLVQYIRTCSEQELKKIHDKIYKSQDKKTQSLIEHSLAVAGSKNTIQHLLRHFHHVSTPRLVQMLKSIQETPFPSEQIAQLLHEFIQTERCSGSPVLQQAAWLAYGAVVRGAIGKTAETHAIPASQEFKSHAARIMKVLFERADTIYEKVLALKTVANSGLDHNIALLQKVISDKKQPTIVRMEAIDALRHLSEQIPRRIQQLLMPVYSNRLEKNEIRMAALRQLVQAKPALPELSQIVLRMEREPNQHVAAYTYHLLSSLMESPLPAHRNISILASNLLRTSLYRPESRILSIVKHWSVYSQDSLSGLSLQLGSLLGKDSVIPKDMMVALETLFGGNWNKQLAQIGFSQQNVEALFNKLISRLSRWEKKESISRASRVSIKKSVTVLKDLAQQLNIRVRQSTTEEPFAMLYFRYKQMDYALLPLDEQYLDQLIENYVRDGSFDLKKLERLFNTDSDFEFATAGFVMDSMMKISNSLGLPMVFYNKMPTVFGINGKISMEKVPYGLRVRVQAQPRLSALYFHSMHVWVPSFTNGFKNLRTAEINLPIDMELEITYKKELEIKLKTQMPKEEEKSLIRLHSRPVCFTRYFKSTKDIFYGYKETTVPMPTIDRMSQDMTKKYEIQGLEFVLSGSNYRLWNLETALLGEHHLDLTVIPSRRIPKELSMKFVIGEVETGTIRGPKIEKMLRKEMETEEGEWESRSESSRIEHLNKIVRDMKLDRAYTHIVKVEVRGHETSEMLIRTECEGNLKFCRLVAELKPEGGRRQWTVKSELEVVLPRPVETIQQLKDQKHREVQVLLETKWGSDDKNTIEILAQLEQSKSQRNMVQRHPELRGLPAHEQLVRLARLNQLKAKINYQLTRENQKVFEQIFDVVKGYAYWSSNVEMADNQEGQVTVKMTSEPLVPGLFNLTVETPETFFRAQQVRVPVVILPSIVRQPKNMIRHTSFEKSECRIQGDRVNSFDDVIFRAPMSNCYTVVAKDCSSAEPRYAVLVKNAKRNGQEKMVKIIYEDNEMELEIVDEKLKVNGKSLRNSELEESRIEKIGEHYVIDLDEVVVRFDGSDIKVLLSNEQMETQCGLCGHFDGEKRNDYRTAGNDETEDLEVFHRSYIVKSDECSIESPKGQKAYRQYNDYTSEEDNDSSEWSEKKSKKVSQKKDSRSEEYDDTEEPESMTAMEEHGHRICFSLEPVPRCPKNMSPQKTTHKKIEFGCLPRHDTRARKWASAIRQGKSVDIDIKKNFSENLSVPTICVA